MAAFGGKLDLKGLRESFFEWNSIEFTESIEFVEDYFSPTNSIDSIEFNSEKLNCFCDRPVTLEIRVEMLDLFSVIS